MSPPHPVMGGNESVWRATASQRLLDLADAIAAVAVIDPPLDAAEMELIERVTRVISGRAAAVACARANDVQCDGASTVAARVQAGAQAQAFTIWYERYPPRLENEPRTCTCCGEAIRDGRCRCIIG